MIKKFLILPLLIGSCSVGIAQTNFNKSLLAGPMLCGISDVGCCIWVQTASSAKTGYLRYWENSDNQPKSDTVKMDFSRLLGKENNPVTIQLDQLKPNAHYAYQLTLNGITSDQKYQFKTQKDSHEENFDEFSFIVGSGHSALDSNNIHDIFNKIERKNPSFMIWTGATMEYPQYEVDVKTELPRLYAQHRQVPKLQNLLGSVPHYAVWDEEELGKKGANKNFPHLKEATNLFKSYWPNYSQFEKGPGNASCFKWNDCEFYLTDNRTFRSPNEEPSFINNNENNPNPLKRYLGVEQMSWLANKLLKSNATYKFIVGGEEWLNTTDNGKGSFRKQFPIEYEEIYHYLKDNKIRGVIFLSGGRGFNQFLNHTENKEEGIKNFYLLSDYTCGPLTGKVDYSVWQSPEKLNSRRMGGALVTENSFVQVVISGPSAAQRNAKFIVFDKNGYVKYKVDVPIYTLWHEYHQ